ncbi:MAG: transposase [Cyclobacteriaceae bacterium]|nr:transposase [Cyclobacteriaceae bacterium]
MHLTEGEIYHIYNRGINREVIFPRRENYRYFLQGVQRWLKPRCDILAWCLMPNHFHFLIHANAATVPMIHDGSIDRQQFSQGIKQLLSSYAKAINKQESRVGNLFQQKTKAREVSSSDQGHPLTAFHYVHQNPMRAKIVQRMEDWEFSSFNEYMEKGTLYLCNRELAINLLDLNPARIYDDSYEVIHDDYTSSF